VNDLDDVTGNARTDTPDTTLDISVVLPCLDEEASVGACVSEALEAITAAGLTGEVVVVDNGSTDDSAQVAREAGARVVVELEPGYGNAIASGVSAARGRVVVMADADSTYPLDRVVELARPVLDGGADIVLGNRMSDANDATMPFLHRTLGTPVLSWLNRRAAPGLRVRDSQSGFRAFGRAALIERSTRPRCSSARHARAGASPRSTRATDRALASRSSGPSPTGGVTSS
jgi:glycosyltransferase involved in cell wall biosynthesis